MKLVTIEIDSNLLKTSLRCVSFSTIEYWRVLVSRLEQFLRAGTCVRPLELFAKHLTRATLHKCPGSLDYNTLPRPSCCLPHKYF